MMLVVLLPMAQVCDVIYTTVLWGGGGGYNIFCLTETGRLHYIKKFEYDVSCFTAYGSGM